MKKILIFGNSGSGKSTLAKQISQQEKLAHLDLDTLAWLPSNPPERALISDSKVRLDQFTQQHNGWVIEGGYTDLLALLEPVASEIIFLNLEESLCIENAKKRPWEAHKYASKDAQDENLDMLINWIKDYAERDDVFSFQSHWAFYRGYSGKKSLFTANQ